MYGIGGISKGVVSFTLRNVSFANPLDCGRSNVVEVVCCCEVVEFL